MEEKRGFRFTIVDLLAAMACVAVLLALFMPAIRHTRGPAQRSACNNNLRQFVLAATNFESQSLKLPANRRLRVTNSGSITVGWVYDLLPFLEQQPVYDRLKLDATDALANGARIPLLICPNDPTIQRATELSYLVNGGCPNNSVDNFDVPANGVGDDLAGIFQPTKRAMSLEVKDGTTQTLYYIENYNAQRWNEDFFHPASESREYFHTVHWIPVSDKETSGVFQTSKPAMPTKQLWAINKGGFNQSGPEFARPSSNHAAGFQAAFVGGNTRYFSESMDYRIYAQLLSSHGARTLDPSDRSEGKTASIRIWQSPNLAPQSYE